ncbi:MAG: zinc-ribbon domain-containing protein [Faecousia sp.]
MFCSKCGNQLKEGDRFCAKCGAPVVKKTEPQEKHAAEPEYSLAPAAGSAEAQPVKHRTAASVQKKSKKGLAIGLSIGGVLIAVLAVVLIFAFGKKGDGDSVGSVPLGSSVVYDDQYTYFLSETETWEPCIKRVQNDLHGKPELLYESEEIKGNGWSQYTLGNIFLWNDKICFMEITKATEQGDREYEIHWLSKDGKENGTLVSYEQLNAYGDLLSQMQGSYFFDDYLIFSNSYFFYRLDLNTGELCKQEDFLDLAGPVCFAAYNDGYYYYFVPDIENNLMGETLYRKSEKSEEEIVGKVPSQDDDDVEKYFSFISKGNYLYYTDLDNIYRLNIEDGSTENLASYEETYNRFALCENGLYYFKDMTLHFLNTETLEETIFDKVERVPNLIYAGADDVCWMQVDSTSHRYNCFLPDEQGGSFVYFGESDQDASTEVQETVNTTELYASIVESALERYGSLSFGGSEYECYAKGVIKLDLKDFNQDGTDELVMLYTPEGEGIFPVVDVWTVQNGEAIQLFSGRSKNESQESEITFSLYENAGCFYIPVYDSLDHNPVYVHLYGFDENGNFGEVYQYENNAFYMNQLPDGKKFAGCNTFSFYFNAQFSGVDAYESFKRTMEESLQGDMEYMLNELGIAMPENSSGNTFSAYDYEGNWTWQQEDSDMTASLQLKATDESTLSGELSFYRFFSDQLTITMSPDHTGTVTSDYGGFQGTARFEAGNLYFSFEDRIFYYDREISEAFGTTEFCFVPANSSTQAGNSEFDVTSMLGEWTLGISQPDAEYVPHYLIRLNEDGTMNLRAEDGSWLDYTYTIDATHFSFTYTGTGLSSSGTYVIDGDKLIFYEENDVN